MIRVASARLVAMAILVGAGCVALLGAGCPLRADEPAKVAPSKIDPLPRTMPVPPAEAAATIRAQHGFRLELLAAEPLVMDPVAIDYDEDGRAWVVEMSDYPYTDKTTDKPFVERTTDLPLGRVRVLEDRDGDGRFDESFLFAEQLSWPTGLAFWKGGVFVAATPDIWYLKDTDGDHRADVRRKVFTGFRKFNVQAVMNNLRWGLDGRIYGAGSSNGGSIRHGERAADTPLALGRHDFRFSPLDERLELISGGARFGNSFDDWGNRFLCNIRNPVQHVLLPAEYLGRNPFLPVRPAVHDAAEAGDTLPVFRISPVEPWRAVRARRWAAESGQAYPRSETRADGYFTSSSGVTIYRGAAYPPEFHGNAFLGEVAANAIHRQRVVPEGVTFRATRADADVEFVASTDNWFRPVNFVNAPDGTLHVLDMYRESIEHPWSIPDDIKAELDLESGRDRGRVYRLSPPGFVAPPPPRLGQAATIELVRHLENPNSWWRETAQRLLFERQDQAAATPLHDLARTSRFDVARMHALWVLHSLGQLTEDDLLAALRDTSAPVREHAVRLSEPRLAGAGKLRAAVARMAEDGAIRVRFQVAFSLGTLPDRDGATRAALAAIARRDAADPWLRTAVLSGDPQGAIELLEALWNDDRFVADIATAPLLREASACVGALHPSAQVERLLGLVARRHECQLGDNLSDRWLQSELLIGLGEGLQRAGRRLTAHAPAGSPAAERIEALLAEARRAATDESLPLDVRGQAIRMLTFGEFSAAKDALTRLLGARQPPQVQQAAVRALASFSDSEVGELLLAAYRGLTPTVRVEAVESMLARSERHAALLAALEERTISIGQITATRRNLLLNQADESLRSRARRLFAADAPGPRAQAIKDYGAALRIASDAKRGQQVYARECANCHRLDGQGHDVGPNLESIRHRIPDELLVNILDPNREVSPNYVEYVATLTDGRVLTGIVAAETPAGVVLRRAQAVEDTIPRERIDALAAVGKSLMPEGLEQKLNVQDMADLLAYLRTGR